MDSETTDERSIVCRCEDITLGEIKRYILDEGLTDINLLKRASRCGMGTCQSKTCRPLVLRELARLTGENLEDLPTETFRPPTKPVKLESFLGRGSETNG